MVALKLKMIKTVSNRNRKRFSENRARVWYDGQPHLHPDGRTLGFLLLRLWLACLLLQISHTPHAGLLLLII